ncbi:MAG: hypothetical protein RBU21_18060 [FCB group bacterium]|jgi:hypothetical protein|nr:hypothetical protein [FCB group bacterium]
MAMFYTLDANKRAIPCRSAHEWGVWFATADRVVARDTVGEVVVSTVFLGIDHNFHGQGDPLLFETMVFLADGEPGRLRRYFIWGEAEQGHREIMQAIQVESEMASVSVADVITSMMQRFNVPAGAG